MNQQKAGIRYEGEPGRTKEKDEEFAKKKKEKLRGMPLTLSGAESTTSQISQPAKATFARDQETNLRRECEPNIK